MIRLDVWVTLPNAERLRAGELAVAKPDGRGRLRGQFRYTPDYLADKRAFPLDPVHLPLSASIYDADDPRSGLHGVFRDALPDDWGKRLLARRYRLSPAQQRPPRLLALRGDRIIGALQVSEPGVEPGGLEGGVPIDRLSALLAAARRMELPPKLEGAEEDEAMALLYRAGSSPGGARPKALVTDGELEYIAKFPAGHDRYDLVALEYACLRLAHMAGVPTTSHRLVDVDGTRALLVERFDLTSTGGRRHMLSFETLLGVGNWYELDYSALVRPLRTLSDNPSEDLQQLFRQAVFNALIGNTDDHLKNFSVFYGEDGWRLTPAYDLLPNITGNLDHVLRFGVDAGLPSKRTLLDLGRRFGISSQRANAIIDEVASVVSDWPEVFIASGVPDRDIGNLAHDLNVRAVRISPPADESDRAPS